MYRLRRGNKTARAGSSWQKSDITAGRAHTLVLGPEYAVNSGPAERLANKSWKQVLETWKQVLETKSWKLVQTGLRPSTRPGWQPVELAVFSMQVRNIRLHPHR